jgi:NAD(P)-dependent dehydrogenase (short-subunit alcohol dehydrogenase family)
MAEGEATRARQPHRDHLQVCAVDLRRPEDIRAFAKSLGSQTVHALIHCAGVCGHVDTMIQVHVLGPARLTLALLPNLSRCAHPRLVFVGSDSHALGTLDMDDFWMQKRGQHVKVSFSIISVFRL